MSGYPSLTSHTTAAGNVVSKVCGDLVATETTTQEEERFLLLLPPPYTISPSLNGPGRSYLPHFGASWPQNTAHAVPKLGKLFPPGCFGLQNSMSGKAGDHPPPHCTSEQNWALWTFKTTFPADALWLYGKLLT